jgi:hypothetical protein
MLGNKQYCYTLTVADYASRLLNCCDGLASTREAQTFTALEQLIKEYGLPRQYPLGQLRAHCLR